MPAVPLSGGDGLLNPAGPQQVQGSLAPERFPLEKEENDRLPLAEAVTLISKQHLPDEVYAEAARVFSEQELVDLNLAVMSINSWNRLSIAFRYEPERE